MWPHGMMRFNTDSILCVSLCYLLVLGRKKDLTHFLKLFNEFLNTWIFIIIYFNLFSMDIPVHILN